MVSSPGGSPDGNFHVSGSDGTFELGPDALMGFLFKDSHVTDWACPYGLPGEPSSLGVVPFARVHTQFATGLLRRDIDGAVLIILLEESRFVGNQIAAADCLLKLSETALEIATRTCAKGRSAGALS